MAAGRTGGGIAVAEARVPPRGGGGGGGGGPGNAPFLVRLVRNEALPQSFW